MNSGNVFGFSLTDTKHRIPLERPFMQTYPCPKLLCGGHRSLEDKEEERKPKNRRVYVRKIDPDQIIEKSARKLPAAIDNQRDHDAKRRRCEQEGKALEKYPTFRREFCAHGANPTVDQRVEKTVASTRREEITTRHSQALERMEADNRMETSNQLRENFETQSARTSALVENLYQQFETKLELADNKTPLNTILAQNKAFVRSFRSIRSTEDYVKMVLAHGLDYALTPSQCEELGSYLNLDRGQWRHAVVAAGQILHDLEELAKEAQKEGL